MGREKEKKIGEDCSVWLDPADGSEDKSYVVVKKEGGKSRVELTLDEVDELVMWIHHTLGFVRKRGPTPEAEWDENRKWLKMKKGQSRETR